MAARLLSNPRSGNCSSVIGTVSGVQVRSPDEALGVVWLDGHADFSTPETCPFIWLRRLELTQRVEINIVRGMTFRTPTARDVARTCLCLHVQRAARTVGRRYDRAFRPLGITNGQFSILMVLSRPQPVGMAELAKTLGMDRTTLTAALKPLAHRGLVQLDQDADDRRARRITVTEAGRMLIGEAVPVWARVQAEIGRALPDIEQDRLRADLKAMA